MLRSCCNHTHTHGHTFSCFFFPSSDPGLPARCPQSAQWLSADAQESGCCGSGWQEDDALGVLAAASVSACEGRGSHGRSRVGTCPGDAGLAVGVGVGCGTVPPLSPTPLGHWPHHDTSMCWKALVWPQRAVSLWLGGQQWSGRALKTNREEPQGRRQQRSALANPTAASAGSILPSMPRHGITVPSLRP